MVSVVVAAAVVVERTLRTLSHVACRSLSVTVVEIHRMVFVGIQIQKR